MADMSVSKTDAERHVGSNPTPGTTPKNSSLKSLPVQVESWEAAIYSVNGVEKYYNWATS